MNAKAKLSPGATDGDFPIVGVGASAGGLEAFTRLLKRLPVDTGMAFVLVQHLDPDHPSALTQILTRATAMPVHEVTNNLRVEANHVYIIPPNTALGLVRGVLKLQPRSRSRIAPRSIDTFFEALAQDRQERAIGVILSGTATDGTLGLEAIKAAGGITLAQDDSAKYDSMPRSAVGAGCVDFVLSPERIARELARIARHPSLATGRLAKHDAPTEGENWAHASHSEIAASARGAQRGVTASADAPGESPSRSEIGGYQAILLLLRNHTGVDFSLYKTTTIHRRITRRTVLNKQPTLAHYATYLQGNTKELDALYSDALISVTSFFRNADAFAVLQQKVFSKLLQEGGDEPVRIWVLGCSTGQEAYSIAMAFAECAEKVPRPRKLQVFATDLNEANLDRARHGLYAKSVAQDLSPERLRRFFSEEDGGYRVIKSLRELVVFARQNLINDPPFSRLDLISCRNLMIYLEPSLQKKVIPTLHYALRARGCLFLGASESIGSFSDLFEPVDKKQKIFVKKAAPTLAFQLPMGKTPATRTAAPAEKNPDALRVRPARPAGAVEAFRGELSAEREADRVTLNQFAPPSVLINAHLQILQFRGSTGAFLQPPTGKASFDVLKMAREGLMLPLRAAINAAKKANDTARKDNVPMRHDGKDCVVNIEVVPLKNLKESCYLILFEDAEQAKRAALRPAGPPPLSAMTRQEESSRIAALERDLTETRDYIQSVEEQQEAANEELQASNEEGQSANEELQSLNEELETSKEELESTNEELTTVNEEMVNRNTELSRLNSDLTNFQASTQLVVVLLGRDFTVRRFSPQAEKKFHLLAGDLHRSFREVRHGLDVPDLEAFVTEVITSVREQEREVRDRDGRWYSLKVRPYLSAENKVDGAVLVLIDINTVKEFELEVTHARDFAEAIISTARDPIVVLDAELRVQKANPAFFSVFRVSAEEVVGRVVFESDRGVHAIPQLRELLAGVLPRGRTFNNFQVTHRFSTIGLRTMLFHAQPLGQAVGHRDKILLGIQDVTEVLAFQADLRRSELRYRRLFEAAHDGILMLDPVTRRITEANPYIVKLLGYTRDQLLKKELWQIGLLRDEAANQQAFLELKEKGFIRYEGLPLKSQKGRRLEVEFVSNRYDEGGQEVIQCNIRDITDRKQIEDALRRSEERYRSLFNSIDEGFCVVEMIFGPQGKAVDYRFLEATPSFQRQSGLSAVLGKRMRTLAPQHEEHWFRTYGKVAVSGKAVRFVSEAKALKRWFDVYAFRVGGPESRKVGVLFRDITERQRADVALREARAQLAHHAEKLEGLVAVRTAQAMATNRRLEASVKSVVQGREKYRRLLEESELMQKQLRHLARQILTAQEDERRKISRDLHDDVVQMLVGINVELSALARSVAPEARPLRTKIGHVQRLVEKSVNAVHQFARELRPAVLDDLGLIPALQAFMKTIVARKKMKIRLTAFAGVEALDNDRRTVLYRVAQEALLNVVRHAQASLVDVTISEQGSAVRMEVQDNGKSFDVARALSAKTNKRLGLLGMRERVEMLGGAVTIESALGRGTTVRAELPFRRKEAV